MLPTCSSVLDPLAHPTVGTNLSAIQPHEIHRLFRGRYVITGRMCRIRPQRTGVRQPESTTAIVTGACTGVVISGGLRRVFRALSLVGEHLEPG